MTARSLPRGAVLPLALLTASWAWPAAVAQTRLATPLDEMNHRSDPAMWFDLDLGLPVLFGGSTRQPFSQISATRFSTGFWGYDDAGLHRLPGDLSDVSTVLAYDPQRRIVVQVGSGHTFEWDGVRLVDHGLAPGFALFRQSDLVFDPARGEVMAFVGSTSNAVPNEVWHWDGQVWTQDQPANLPSPRTLSGLVADTTRGQVLLVGGLLPSGTRTGSTWIWDGADWSTTSGTGAPSSSRIQRMTHDPHRGRTILIHPNPSFGSSPHAGLWEWAGNGWSHALATPLDGEALTYDRIRQLTIVYAHRSLTAGDDELEILTWDGTNLQPEFERTAPRDVGRLVTDEAHGDVAQVHFDSDSGSLEVHVGGSDGWTRDSQLNIGTPRQEFALAHDRIRNRLVLFGGGIPQRGLPDWLQDETWLYDRSAGTWQLAAPASAPPARQRAAMHWDPAGNQVLLFGGLTNVWNNDTWRWDGSNWTRLQPSTTPPLMIDPEMTIDPATGRLVVAGRTGPGARLQIWEWTGADWRLQASLADGGDVVRFGADRALNVEVLVLTQATWIRSNGVWRTAQNGDLPEFEFESPQLAWDPGSRRLLLRGHQQTAALWTVTIPDGGASAETFGMGCIGSQGAPRLLTNRLPRLDEQDFAIRLASARASSAAALVLSFSPAPANPLPCTILFDPATAAVMPPWSTDAAGQATLGLPVPASATLTRASFVAQAAVLDPAGGFLGTLTLSNGLEVTLGR